MALVETAAKPAPNSIVRSFRRKLGAAALFALLVAALPLACAQDAHGGAKGYHSPQSFISSLPTADVKVGKQGDDYGGHGQDAIADAGLLSELQRASCYQESYESPRAGARTPLPWPDNQLVQRFIPYETPLIARAGIAVRRLPRAPPCR